MISVEIQYAYSGAVEVPTQEKFQQWAEIFESDELIESDSAQEVCIRIIDEAEMTELNLRYRDKNSPTNVLAFPCETPEGVSQNYIGDVIICAPVVTQQASAQQKSIESHWAHLTLHGILHLLGYDHIVDADAEIMEKCEVQLMAKLGFPNPYL